MDKTHNISLGGMAFLIDDNAYSSLKNYLNQIRFSLNNASGIDEIISDVEYRMAELLRERLMSREVVNQTDIDYLIGVMGKPEDYYSEEFLDDEEAASSNKAYSHAYNGRTSKKLFRDSDDKMLGGVCSGLGHYLGIDATWVRIIAVVLLFIDPIFFSVGGTIFIAYIILWLVVPETKTTSDKLQMRGEPVNFDSIKDFFGNSPETARNNLKDFGDDARRVANNSGSVVGNILRAIVKLIGFFFLGILLIIALSLLISFFAMILGLGGAFFGVGIAGFSLGEYFPYLFENNWETWVTYISLALLMIIPAVALILAVLRLISKRYRVPRAVGFGLPLLWLAGLIGAIAVGVTTLRHFQKTATDERIVNIDSEAQTLVLKMDDDYDNYSIGISDGNDALDIKPGYFAIPKNNDVRIRKSETDQAYLQMNYIAKGKTRKEAQKNLQTINYNYEIKDSLIRLDDYVFIKEGDKWRNQKIRMTLFLPENKQIMFKNIDAEVREDGSYNWYGTNSEKIYTFENGKLKCVNCPEKEEAPEEEKNDDNNSASININADDTKISAKDGVIKIIDGEDSVIIKTNKNGTGHISISHENDSISN